MSNTSSKCRSSPSRASTASAWRRVPLVRISLRPGSFSIAAPERRIGLERRMVDLMHEIEEVVGLHAVLGHHPAHRGAVALVVVLLQAERLLVADLEKARDVVADALVDLLPQIEVMRIKRVVEIEHPGLDVAEGARARRTRGIHDAGPGP